MRLQLQQASPGERVRPFKFGGAMLIRSQNYSDVYDNFTWNIPEYVNMGIQVSDAPADRHPQKSALIVAGDDGSSVTYSFADIKALSNKLANFFTAKGLRRGDRVGTLLSQSVEAAVSHVAAWKMGAISIPLFMLFGEDALGFRLSDSGARMLVTDTTQLAKIEPIRNRLPALETILVVDTEKAGKGTEGFWSGVEKASDQFKPVATHREDPSFICYTSGTTGNPKGALHAHRSLMGHIPAVEFFHSFLPREGDLMWTPADWAWIGGLMNTLMGSWYHGVTMLAYRARKYDPEEALRLMAKYRVRNTFIPPTALKLMRAIPNPRAFGTDLRSVAVAGEPMGAELLAWGREALGVTFNEYYGQTEANLILANNYACMEIKPGSMGRPVPGHTVAVIDPGGNELPPGEMGQVAVRRPDPSLQLEYWNNREVSENKFIGDWWPMGDQATVDEDGYFFFVGRDDDVITTAGYRVGPGEIEDCLIKHPSVSLAAAIGVPDPIRTEAIKVFIKLMPGFTQSQDMEEEIRNFVKKRLSPHEYPRIIEFVEDLPLTSTGKIRRKNLRDSELDKLK
jgi:acetyl-CoA synthetase